MKTVVFAADVETDQEPANVATTKATALWISVVPFSKTASVDRKSSKLRKSASVALCVFRPPPKEMPVPTTYRVLVEDCTPLLALLKITAAVSMKLTNILIVISMNKDLKNFLSTNGFHNLTNGSDMLINLTMI